MRDPQEIIAVGITENIFKIFTIFKEVAWYLTCFYQCSMINEAILDHNRCGAQPHAGPEYSWPFDGQALLESPHLQ